MEKEELCRYKLSSGNTQRLLERKDEIDGIFRKLLNSYSVSEADVRKEVNRKLYELAQNQGVSLWDLCFKVVPRVDMRVKDECPYGKTPPWEKSFRMEMEYDITLIPLELTFDKDNTDWKKKYFDLKKKVEELVKDD